MSKRSGRRQPSLDWPFARQCARAEDLSDLRDLLQVEIERLGFRYFCCCSHVRPDQATPGAIYLQNYPRSWLLHYQSARLYERDPIFVLGGTFARPFLWTDPDFLALLDGGQAAVMAAAAAHGLKHGVTIPLHGPGRTSASCSLVGDSPDIDAERVFTAQRFASEVYDAARTLAGAPEGRPCIALAPRERECLKLVALGKDDEAIAIILGIGRETVRRHVEMAKERLGVSKRSHAVAYAIYTQAINVEDLFGA